VDAPATGKSCDVSLYATSFGDTGSAFLRLYAHDVSDPYATLGTTLEDLTIGGSTGTSFSASLSVVGGLVVGTNSLTPTAGVVRVEQPVSGDPRVVFGIAAGEEWAFGVDDSDGDALKVHSGGALVDVSLLALTSAGLLMLNENACADVTVGLVINQGGADDGLAAGKSSDVAHGMTSLAETDTYLLLGKSSATAGGVKLQGFSEDSVGLELVGNVTADLTTKTTGGFGAINLKARKKSGTGIGNMGSDANLVAILNNETARFLFDAEGSAHADVEWTTFDEHDDLALLEDLEGSFGGWVEDRRAVLERLGVAHFDDRPGHAMVNFTRLAMLLTGAVRQLGQRVDALLPAPIGQEG